VIARVGLVTRASVEEADRKLDRHERHHAAGVFYALDAEG
jgi:hypothetical protein